MLINQPIDLILDVPDLEEAKRFYVDVLGLRVLREDARGAVDLAAGGDSRISLRRVEGAAGDEQTRGSFRVGDLRAEMAELRAWGVVFKDYDSPGVSTTDGIADLGFGLGAWLVDPGKNVIGLIEQKK